MKKLIVLLALPAIFVLTACASVRVNTLPPPPASPKLRVYIQPHSTRFEGKGAWAASDDVFGARQVRLAEKFLSQSGIYEIVSEADVRAAVGEQHFTRSQMEQNDWALAREIGRALHADYVMVMERGVIGITHTQYFVNALINVQSGRKFGVRYSFSKSWTMDKKTMQRTIRASYRDIFRSAKQDLLATAMQKSETLTAPQTGRKPAQPPAAVKEQEQAEAETPVLPQKHDWITDFDAQKALTEDAMPAKPGETRLVVYDLDAEEQYRPVALILSEALREELFRLGRFVLVNREDLGGLLKEMALQQTGLIDEKEAVRMGKGLAANQVVTGRLGLLGKTFLLQAKRTDVETFATLSLTSAKFGQGGEDDVLAQLPGMARQLAGGVR